MKNHSSTTNGITREVEVGAVTLDGAPYVSNFQKKDTLTAMFRQEIKVKSIYPAARISDERNDNFFGAEEFGFEGGQEFVSVEKRVAFMDVPTNTTVEVLNARLAANSEASLYKVLSNKPILTSGQLSAVTNGLRTYDEFANSQVIRYPEGHIEAGKLILDSFGKVQYRAIYLSSKDKEDEDYRSETSEAYISPEIAVELANTPTSATLVPDQSL